MEQLFQDSCRAVQTILDTDSRKIWEYFQAAVCECLEKTKSLQQQNQKGILHYLAFSPMQYAPFLDRLELRIDALDDGFYLDTHEASAHYYADFFQDRFQEDLAFLYEKAAEKFIRIQHFEQVDKGTDWSDTGNSRRERSPCRRQSEDNLRRLHGSCGRSLCTRAPRGSMSAEADGCPARE